MFSTLSLSFLTRKQHLGSGEGGGGGGDYCRGLQESVAIADDIVRAR